jgi:tRNA threonylcarbamoyladenosine biosynthesis protein TsaB
LKILAIDTALKACSVALFDTTGVSPPVSESVPMLRGHAEALMPMVARVVAAARLPFSDIDRYAVTVGPGTFTGIRVGVAAGRGLSLAAGRPLIGITTLEAYAAELADESEGAPVAIALDARRGEVYFQTFDSAGQPLSEAAALAPEAAAESLGTDAVLAGSGARLVADALSALGRTVRLSSRDLGPGPDPMIIARLATEKAVPDRRPAPLYLRPADAKPQPGAVARQADGRASAP